jgi:hypothetical protein
MNTLSQSLTKLTLLISFLVLAAGTAQAQAARLQMGQLDSLVGRAKEAVDVNVDERMIQLTLKFFGKDEDEKEIKQVITGLKGIYVKSFEFEKDGEYSANDFESISSQLKNPAWSRILNVTSKKDGAIEVYMMHTGSEIGGLAVLATNTKELTVVNIIGPVDIEKLAKLEGQFGVPDLEIEIPPKPTEKKN